MARRNKAEERAIVRGRIATLMALAEAAAREGRLDRAHRYAELSWRMKTGYQLAESGCEARVCRRCHAFLQPGVTSRVRLTGGKLTRTCLRCGATRRVPLRPRAPAAEGVR